MKRLVRLFVSTGALALAAVGVSGAAWADHGAEDGAPEESSSPTTGPGAGGMFAIAVSALGDLEVRDDQRTAIQALVNEAELRHLPFLEAVDGLMRTVADQIEDGTLARKKLAGPMETLGEEAACIRTGNLAALDSLHGVLDAQQRDQFATSLQKLIDEHVEAHASGEWVDDVSEKLGLSDDQEVRMKAAVYSFVASDEFHDKMESKLDRIYVILAGFRGEDFDATFWIRAHDGETEARAAIASMLQFIEDVLPILTPEQRVRAADLVRSKLAGDEAEEEDDDDGDETGSVSQELVGAFVPPGTIISGGSLFGRNVMSRYSRSYAYGSRRSYSAYYSTGYPFGWAWGHSAWGW